MKRTKVKKILKGIIIVLTLIIISALTMIQNMPHTNAASGEGWTTEIPEGIENIESGLIISKTTNVDNGRVINGRTEANNFDKNTEVTIDYMLWMQNGRPGNYTYPKYAKDYIFDLHDGEVRMRYDNIGTYQGENVGCYVTYSAKDIEWGAEGLINISGCFYNGFYLLGVKHCNVYYAFFKMSEVNNSDPSKTPRLKIKNSLFSVYSLNDNEEVTYVGNQSSPVYLSEGSLVRRQSELNYYFWRGSSDNFVDTQTSDNYKTAGVSFKFNESLNTHHFIFGSHNAVNPYGEGCAWFFPSSVPIGVTKIPPKKTVDKTEANVGETLTYTVTQKIHEEGLNIAYGVKYSSLNIYDKFQSDLEIDTSSINITRTSKNGQYVALMVENGNVKNGCGTLNIGNDNSITFMCNDSFLKNNLSLAGQTIKMTIKCKIKSIPENKDKAIINEAYTRLNGVKMATNEVKTIVKTIPPEKRIVTSESQAGDVITYSVTQRLIESSEKKYTKLILWDELPEQLSYDSATVKLTSKDGVHVKTITDARVTTNNGVIRNYKYGSLTTSTKDNKTTVTYTFNTTYLKNDLNLAGQTVELKIKCKIKDGNGNKTISNTAYTDVDGTLSNTETVHTIIPKKEVDKTQVNPGDTVKFTVTQRLRKNPTLRYTKLNIWDEIPKELKIQKINVKIDETDITNDTNKGSLSQTGQKVTYQFNKKYLNSFVLSGQIVKMIIECKVDYEGADFNSTVQNTAYTNIDDVKVKTNTVTVKINPIVANSISKSGTSKITDPEENVTYNINYRGRVQYNYGNVNITIQDVLPYKIDTSKSDLNGGKYDDAKKTITWNESIDKDNIRCGKVKSDNISINKKITVVFKGIQASTKSMTNKVYGQLQTVSPKVTSDKVEAEAKTTMDFKINVKAKKTWDDAGASKNRRPSTLWFVLYANGSPTNQTYALSPRRKDEEECTFANLDKFDSNGQRITYTVKEIAKIEDGKYYTLQDLKGNNIKEKNDLKYYVDSSKVTEEEKAKGNKTKDYEFTNHYVSLNINGNVWLESSINGRKENSESGFKGVSVKLIYIKNDNGNIKYEFYDEATDVRTNANGDYSFTDLPWNGTYKIRFFYNGQVYESTYYKDNLSGGYSNAKEYTDTRENLNKKFYTISAYPNNYANTNRAFGLNQKIKNSNDNEYNFKSDNTAYTFSDILDIFNDMESRYTEYDDDFYIELRTKLVNSGINYATAVKLIQYIQDSTILADTSKNYTIKNITSSGSGNEVNISGIGKVKTGANNTVQYVDYGLAKRATNDLAVMNDIYKITSVINGKVGDEIYNSKKEEYNISQRARDDYYTGKSMHEKNVYKSDYLYNGADIGQDAKRNLQVFVTYRIRIKNKGSVSAIINSIKNYYDNNNLEPIDSIQGSSIYQNNTFNGDNNFNKIGNITVTNDTSSVNGYGTLLITGENNGALKVHHSNNSNDTILYPDEETDVYITFKVKNDGDKVKINTQINNIAELNNYSTLYTPNGDVAIPDVLNSKNEKVNKKISTNTEAGIVDINSDPGSLRSSDLENGALVYNKKHNEKTYNNMENDTDQIKLNLKLENDTKKVRSISGIVFEDNRNSVDEKNKASLGNGYYDNNETPINGVTVQLVELIPEIDENGISKGNYIAEKVWSNYVYGEDLALQDREAHNNDENNKSYYSGIGKSQVIISGTGANAVAPKNIAKGMYQFDSMQPGDFYVRFTYGDTVRTTLKKDNNEVNKLINENNYKGLNDKSYNGQDYKSTIYQEVITPDGNYEFVNQDGNYNGINGYKNYETQNYSKATNLNDKNLMYYYDLQKSNNMNVNGQNVRLSDAKDVYDFRTDANNYSKTLTNENGEILDSFEKVASYTAGKTNEEIKKQQKTMIQELMNKTQMRAQTGVMDININHNNTTTNQVDLGLVERARAQVTLEKEVTNIKIILANGNVLFNSDKSVHNLFFAHHQAHTLVDGGQYQISGVRINKNENNISTPELIQCYMDSEIMAGATMTADYRITVRNLSEVDFKDIKYYYTGIEDKADENLSKVKVNDVVTYMNNATQFSEKYQNKNDNWVVVNSKDILDQKLVTKEYENRINTYNTLLLNEGFNLELTPELYNEKDSNYSVALVAKSGLTPGVTANSLVYNSMAEIVKSTSELGRRNYFSIPGNEQMTDQNILENAAAGQSKDDRIVPSEVDSDSAQKQILLPPTGKQDYTLIIIGSIIAVAILGAGAFIIKKALMNKE